MHRTANAIFTALNLGVFFRALTILVGEDPDDRRDVGEEFCSFLHGGIPTRASKAKSALVEGNQGNRARGKSSWAVTP